MVKLLIRNIVNQKNYTFFPIPTKMEDCMAAKILGFIDRIPPTVVRHNARAVLSPDSKRLITELLDKSIDKIYSFSKWLKSCLEAKIVNKIYQSE